MNIYFEFPLHLPSLCFVLVLGSGALSFVLSLSLFFFSSLSFPFFACQWDFATIWAIFGLFSVNFRRFGQLSKALWVQRRTLRTMRGVDTPGRASLPIGSSNWWRHNRWQARTSDRRLRRRTGVSASLASKGHVSPCGIRGLRLSRMLVGMLSMGI